MRTADWWTDAPGLRRIEEAIEETERRSAVEVVVAVSPVAGDYRAEAYLAGAIASLAFLLFVALIPYEVSLEEGLAAVVGAGLMVGTFALRDPRLAAWLAGKEWRRVQTRRSAGLTFLREAVSGTRDRTGILVYLGALEQEVVVLPDAGVLGRVGSAPFHRMEAAFAASQAPVPDRLVTMIGAVGDLLEAPLPRAEDDQDELPNQVRVIEAGDLDRV